MNTAPESLRQNGWTEEVTAYFTFGPGDTTGIYVLTILGIILFAGALVAWVNIEDRHIREATERLRTKNGGVGGAPETEV